MVAKADSGGFNACHRPAPAAAAAVIPRHSASTQRRLNARSNFMGSGEVFSVAGRSCRGSRGAAEPMRPSTVGTLEDGVRRGAGALLLVGSGIPAFCESTAASPEKGLYGA